MTGDRMDALMTEEYQSNGETKTAWTKVGVAFPLKNGGMKVRLKSVPVAQRDEKSGAMEVTFVLMPPRERDEKPRGGNDSPF